MNNENENHFDQFCQNEKQRLLSYEEDWNEDGGSPTTEKIVDIAFNFLKNHCSSNKYLDVDLCPDGSIDFEWHRMFTLGTRAVLLINIKENRGSYYGESIQFKIKNSLDVNEISEELKNFITLYFK